MWEIIDKHFTNIHKAVAVLYSVLLIFLIGFLDFFLGREIVMSVFYALPILLIAWYGRLSTAIFMVCFATSVWFFADFHSGQDYRHWAIPYWNSLVRFLFLLILILVTNKLKKSLEYEKSLSRIDSLTMLANGRGFRELANIELQKSFGTNKPFTVAYIDLDNFKFVNDNFGHERGDELLVEVARIFQNSLRSTDKSARLGGDEFALLLPETGLEEAKIAISHLREKFLKEMQSNQWPVTASIGVLTFEVSPPSISAMIKMTDDLMYAVKSSGKNNATFHSYRPSVVP